MDNSLSLPNPDTPSLSRRQFLNFLTGSAIAATAATVAYPAAKFLMAPAEGTGEGAVLAKDKLGHPIPASQILKEVPGSRALVAGLAGEPTYLTVTENGLDETAIVNNCTHLGCTFPWNGNASQFQCPCHGSRFGPDGQVERGPANRPLKLARVRVEGEAIWISPWQGIDPRNGEIPWWS